MFHRQVSVTAHARETAVLFYQHLGYTTVGPRLAEVGLPHVAIRKNLVQE